MHRFVDTHGILRGSMPVPSDRLASGSTLDAMNFAQALRYSRQIEARKDVIEMKKT